MNSVVWEFVLKKKTILKPFERSIRFLSKSDDSFIVGGEKKGQPHFRIRRVYKRDDLRTEYTSNSTINFKSFKEDVHIRIKGILTRV